MADSFNNLWVDSSFLDSSESTKSIVSDYVAADSENIGIYTLPVIYKSAESLYTSLNTTVQYNVSPLFNGNNSFYSEYFAYTDPLKFTVLPTLISYYNINSTTSGTLDTDTLYSTGYNTVSGTTNTFVCFIGANTFYANIDKEIYYRTKTSWSGTCNFDILYSNFSGNIYEPIINTAIIRDMCYTTSSGTTLRDDVYVDISFAGWVPYGFLTDVLATNVFTTSQYLDVDTTVGGLVPNYIDVYSSIVGTTAHEGDVYCSIEDWVTFDTQCSTISGGLYPNYIDVYSTIDNKEPLTCDIELYSLKITNFSLPIGAYTDSSNILSVDIVDDECEVSVSGTYLLVDGSQVVTTTSGIIDGYRLFYDPIDNYQSLTGPTLFTVHAENKCGNVLEQVFYLTFGYIVGFYNYDGVSGIDYGFNSKVAVRVTAEDFASCPTTDSLAFEFESKDRYSSDLSACIKGVTANDGNDQGDLTAKIFPISTAYFYGKEFEVLINVKDFSGNEMEPLLLTYRIEDKP